MSTTMIDFAKCSADIDDDTVDQVTELLSDLVRRGAALGWVEPPESGEVRTLLRQLAGGFDSSESALAVAHSGDELVGLGYWTRYLRPTHRPHADLEKLGVRSEQQGHGVGRALLQHLVASAKTAGIEQLTLDLRADNAAAMSLYGGLGFVEYGRLAEFVVVGEQRLDKVFMVVDLRPA